MAFTPVKSTDGKRANCTVQVADVTRNLHAAGMICDQNHEVLLMKKGAVVGDEGTLSKFLREQDVKLKYHREHEGGLYTTEMVLSPSEPAGFHGQGKRP